MKKKIRNYLIIGLSLLIIFVSLPLTAVFLSAENGSAIGVLADGGIEGTSLYNGRNGRVEADNAFEGSYILDCKNKTICSQKFTLQAGLKYKVSFWYLNETAEENEIFGITSDLNTTLSNRAVDAYAALTEASDWQYADFEFTASKTEYMLYAKGNFKVDAITVKWEKQGAIITNGSFEEGLTGWASSTADNPIRTGNASNGFVYAELPVKKNGGIYCDFNVNRNTNYTVSLDYSGGGTDSAFAVTQTFDNAELKNAVSEVKGFTSSNAWTKTTLTFNSADNTRLRLFIRSGEYGILSVDNVRIDVADSSNLITNGGFENGADGFTVSGGAPDISDITLSGDNSFKFSASGETTVFQRVATEKNKDLTLNFSRSGAIDWAVCSGTLDTPVFSGEGVIKSGSLAENSGWTTESISFKSGENTSLIIAFKASSSVKTAAIDDISLSKIFLIAEKPIILSNGGFEDGLTGWEQRWENGTGFSISETSAEGEKALLVTGGSYNKIGYPFKVEAGKSYKAVFSFSGTLTWNKWSVTSGGYANRHNTDEGTAGYTVGGMITRENMTAYERVVSDTFTATADDTYYFNISAGSNTAMAALFDEIYIFETSIADSTLLVNGDFEYNLSPWWSGDTNVFERENGGYNNSGSALRVTSAANSVISQAVTVEPNTNYELKFLYSGSPSSSVGAYGISKDATFGVTSVLNSGVISKSSDLKEVSTVVNSGDNTVLYILFQSSDLGQYTLDNVTFAKTDKTATAKGSITPAYFENILGGNGHDSFIYISSTANNVIQNGDFEGKQSGSKPDAMKIDNNGTAYVVNENGGSVLRFEAGSQKATALLPLALSKNTEYYLTLKVRSPRISESNLCNTTFGIADRDTGDFLIEESFDSVEGTLFTTESQLIPTAADDNWHMVSIKFNTNDVENLVFKIQGTNSVLFIDDIYIFKSANKVKWKSELSKLTDVTVTNSSPLLLGTKTAADNIITDFDFETDDFTYWADTTSTVYGDTLSIVDTGSPTHGKSFRYSSNRRYPMSIYYIKWVDVEPGTEYTFSANVSVTRQGGGFFGLISGHKTGAEITSTNENIVYPSIIKRYNFNTEPFDEACGWKTIGITFNTKDRNRVGIAIFDGGGEAYIDDIRLFKTAAAAALPTVEDNFPNTLIASGLDFSGGKINLTEDTKLSELLNRFENSEFIRVFRPDGTEVTGRSDYVPNGAQIRLMDGPVIKDRADITLFADLNADGRRDIRDLIRIKKAVSALSKELIYDVNGDGSVNALDLTAMAKIMLKK